MHSLNLSRALFCHGFTTEHFVSVLLAYFHCVMCSRDIIRDHGLKLGLPSFKWMIRKLREESSAIRHACMRSSNVGNIIGHMRVAPEST